MSIEQFAIEAGEWCSWHHQVEPSLPGDFKACFECGHVWRTRAAFEADCEWAAWEHGVPFPHADQPFCPLCIHDF